MIEIARVEPKKIQRKLLTEEQKAAICKKYKKYEIACDDKCPLLFVLDYEEQSCDFVGHVTDAIKDYWNEEIEIGVSE